MSPNLQVDTTEFRKQMQAYSAWSKRELSEIINARLYFVLVRIFALLKPHHPQEARNRIRTYMTELVQERGRMTKKGVFKRHGKTRQLRRGHLIAQAKNAKQGKKGLHGAEMKKAYTRLLRSSVGSVGYLKSMVVRMIRGLGRGFTQFGGRSRKSNGVDIPANAALLQMAREYGDMTYENIGVFRSVKGKGRKATPGINPVAWARGTIGLADGQTGTVSAMVTAAAQRAFADEGRGMAEVIKRRQAEYERGQR